jgi:hypothetical protein
MKMRRFCLILIIAMPLAAQVNHHTINFNGTGLVPTTGSFDYNTTTEVFSNFEVFWPQILGTPPCQPLTGVGCPFDLTSAANNPEGGGCGTTPTAALAFALLEHTLTGCGTGTYEWNAVSIREGGQTLDFTFGPTSTDFALRIHGTAFCSTCGESTGNSGDFSISGATVIPEPSTLGLLGIGLLTGIGTLRRKLLL